MRRIPRNIRSFEESSGGFSDVVTVLPLASDVSEGSVEGTVEEGEGSNEVSGVVEAMMYLVLSPALVIERINSRSQIKLCRGREMIPNKRSYLHMKFCR